MAFRLSTARNSVAESPQLHYRDLPRQRSAVPGLWVHQGDLLRAYFDHHTETSDIALKLPTGTGKTLPGLVLLDWVRLKRRARVVYACPTVQLAKQVAELARNEGVTAVLLTGSHKNWKTSDLASYVSAEAVAIVTYSTIFNSSPKLEAADILLFDDAHAGEQYISEQYSVTVRRDEDADKYLELLDVLRPALNALTVDRFSSDSLEHSVHDEVYMVFPLRQTGMIKRIDEILASLTSTEWFKYSMIRSSLMSCHVFLTYKQVVIRPMIPPTANNRLFADARQRIYLSATLGSGGELERAFGRTGIKRLVFPKDSPPPRSGRRFFVFPELTDGDPHVLAKSIVADVGKALCLAPTTEQAQKTADDLAQDDWDVFTSDDVANGIEPFRSATNAVCGLANRYDGIDLPGCDCRCVVLVGTPDQTNLQERFLSSRIRANVALAERIRTRVVQGAGRCTRGPGDWAVVVVCGSELTRYFNKSETLDALDPELQAEVRFGVQNSRGVSHSEVMDNLRTFRDQGNKWRSEAEPELQKLRNSANKVQPPGTDTLAAAVDKEVEACSLAAGSDWLEASKIAQEVAHILGQGGEHTRGYRALWLYLAGLWLDQSAADAQNKNLHLSARSLIGDAKNAAKPGTWLRDVAPLPGLAKDKLNPADTSAVSRIKSQLSRKVSKNTRNSRIDQMLKGLQSSKCNTYEPALTELGLLLGADASKPGKNGRCDSVWCFDNHLWLVIEAKSEHSSNGSISQNDIRQINNQLKLVKADRQQPEAPETSAALLISPRSVVHPDGVTIAGDDVYLVDPKVILNLAQDVKEAWQRLLASSRGLTGEDLRECVENAFTGYGILPSSVRDRLTQHQISKL